MQQPVYLSNEPDNTFFGLYGWAELNTGNPTAAEYHYKQAVELNPDSQDWSFGLVRSLVD
ncbi:tetratricopeptide repeat protein [Opitutaceae bacterium]|nr:tetratricopeptide repeat protein [Opitutaceae bacterium]